MGLFFLFPFAFFGFIDLGVASLRSTGPSRVPLVQLCLFFVEHNLLRNLVQDQEDFCGGRASVSALPFVLKETVFFQDQKDFVAVLLCGNWIPTLFRTCPEDVAKLRNAFGGAVVGAEVRTRMKDWWLVVAVCG